MRDRRGKVHIPIFPASDENADLIYMEQNIPKYIMETLWQWVQYVEGEASEPLFSTTMTAKHWSKWIEDRKCT